MSTSEPLSGHLLRQRNELEGLASAAAAHERLIAEQSFALHRIWCVVQGLPVAEGPLPDDVPIDRVTWLIDTKWQKAHAFAEAFAGSRAAKATYEWQASTRAGEYRSGIMDADDAVEVREHLIAQGLVPRSVGLQPMGADGEGS